MPKANKPKANIKINSKLYDLKFSELTKSKAELSAKRLRNSGALVRIKKFNGIYYLYVNKLKERKTHIKNKVTITKLKRSPKGHKNLKYVIHLNGKHQGFAETKQEAVNIGQALLSRIANKFKKFSLTRKIRKQRAKVLELQEELQEIS